jgi:hypothetical protein
MPGVSWFSQIGPGDVWRATSTVDARSAADPPALVVVTEGGRVYLRTDTAADPRWRSLGGPPGGIWTSAVACVTTDATGTVAPVVVGGDGRVWLVQPGEEAADWVDLGSPAPDTEALAAATLRRASGLRHVLVVTSDGHRPWLREGLEADGTWFPLPAEAEWQFDEVALAAAQTPGGQPELHLFAVVSGPGIPGRVLRAGVRENAVWTWIDPGPRPDGQEAGALSATSVRDTAGTVRACALVGASPFTSATADSICVLSGSGRTWAWTELGRPPGDGDLRASVVARGDPAAGGPVVIARVGHHHWRRSPGREWEDLGTTPGDVAVVDPLTCLEFGSGEPSRIQTIGVSWDQHLWTVDIDGAAARWRDHGITAAPATVVGTYTDAQEPGTIGLLSHVFLTDTDGRLWESRLGGIQLDSWDDHGLPAPRTGCRTGVGALAIPGRAGQRSWVFVLATDGRLWARSEGPDGWVWVDHGMPSDRRINATAAPVATEPSAGDPTVPVVGDDGQLWLRTPVGGEWTWVTRGTPPGLLIFRLVGAALFPTAQGSRLVTSVVTEDGRLFVDLRQGPAPGWIDLGTPLPGERVVAGIGAGMVTLGGVPTLHVVVATAPGGHVWTRSWSPGAAGGNWTDLGRPPGPRLDDGVGVVPDPDDGSGALVFVLADGRKLWVRDSAGRDSEWTAWGLPLRADALAGGRAVALGTRTGAFMTDADAGLWLATAEDL